MHKQAAGALTIAALLASSACTALGAQVNLRRPAPAPPQRTAAAQSPIQNTVAPKAAQQLGRAPSEAELRQRDITVLPDGSGLPEGEGTAAQGELVYKDKCASCHGTNGEGNGAQGPQLIGGAGTLGTEQPIKTVGSYWPYATTVWDYLHRAMPLNAPGSMSANETYAVTAFLLAGNKVIAAGQAMNRDTLPKVNMPNRDGFIPDARPDVLPLAARSEKGSRRKGNSGSNARPN